MDGKRNSHNEYYFDWKLYESKECLTNQEVTFVQGVSA